MTRGSEFLVRSHCTPLPGSRILNKPRGLPEGQAAQSQAVPGVLQYCPLLASPGIAQRPPSPWSENARRPGSPPQRLPDRDAEERWGVARGGRGCFQLGWKASWKRGLWSWAWKALNGSVTLLAQNRTDTGQPQGYHPHHRMPCTHQSLSHRTPSPHLLVGCGRKHLLLMGVLGEVEGVGHHQVAPVEAR